MKVLSSILAALAIVTMFSMPAQAADSQCAVHYTRTACAGQEAVSYKKCDGKQSCVKHKKADSLEACQKAAMKSCRNRRLNITKSKVITATWKGEAITAPGGAEDFCTEYPKKDVEFNKCDQ